MIAIYGLVQMVINNDNTVKNYYTSVVDSGQNDIIAGQLAKYFKPADVVWRGMGIIPGSGLLLKDEYSRFDAGSDGLDEDNKRNKACRCGEILMGKAKPHDCPLFGKVCTPMSPEGACMVSEEGSCFKVKNPPAKAGDTRDMSLIPWSGRFPRVGNVNLLQILAWKIP